MPKRTSSSEKPLPAAPRQQQRQPKQQPPPPPPAPQHYQEPPPLLKYPKPPLHRQLTNFTRTVPGLEKTLRLVQALAQVAAEVVSSHDAVTAAKCASATGQLALTRRYFRFFNFIDSFDRAYHLLIGRRGRGSSHRPETEGMVVRVLDFGKFSALGLYVVLDNLTILHAMNIHPVPWAQSLQTEANKFWFYGLSLSVLGSAWVLFSGVTGIGNGGANKASSKSKGSSKSSSIRTKRWSSTAMKRIVVDACDLLIPGALLGWTGVGREVVGVGMVVSTLISGRDIWRGVNA